jgi:hypothetical protein
MLRDAANTILFDRSILREGGVVGLRTGPASGRKPRARRPDARLADIPWQHMDTNTFASASLSAIYSLRPKINIIFAFPGVNKLAASVIERTQFSHIKKKIVHNRKTYKPTHFILHIY